MRTFIIAAFVAERLRGNPAGVCMLDDPFNDRSMQAIAMRLGQPETAFIRRHADHWSIRWFSPVSEVELCGHATMAAAAAIWDAGEAREAIEFRYVGGRIVARRAPDATIWLDFPAIVGRRQVAPADLADCVDIAWASASRHGDRWVLEYEDAASVRAVRPDFKRLARTGIRSLIVTAPSDVSGYDIVSRNFAPIVGVNEDQATGSAHACLAPYWEGRLGPRLNCLQASVRGGAIRTNLHGDRVALGGHTVIESVKTGKFMLADTK